MKKLLVSAFALTLASLTPTVRADDTPLAKQMEVIDDAFKALRREQDPAKGAKLAREAQDAILKSIPFTPAMLEKMADGEPKSKALAEYRKQMGALYVTFCEIEIAFLSKDLEKVAKLNETLRGQKKEGHNTFIDDEE